MAVTGQYNTHPTLRRPPLVLFLSCPSACCNSYFEYSSWAWVPKKAIPRWSLWFVFLQSPDLISSSFQSSILFCYPLQSPRLDSKFVDVSSVILAFCSQLI